MDLILCHTTADFDTLGAAVGLTRLLPGARVVLTGGCHPTVRDFLALHRDEYRLIERRSVNSQTIRSISVVDVQRRDRLGKAAEWLELPNLEITVYDHHLGIHSDIKATRTQIESVGATTTLIVEQLQRQAEEQERREKGEGGAREQGSRGAGEKGAGEKGAGGAGESNSPFLTPAEATVMALGIHVDTGSLTFDHSTARDARALAWLMEQGASLSAIAEYVDPGLSPQLQELLKIALDNLQTETILGYPVAWVLLETDSYVPGLSSLASQLMEITESDALLLAHRYSMSEKETRLGVIGRSRIAGTNLNELFKPHGGGGHPSAASVILRDESAPTLEQLVEQLKTQIPHPPVARDLMTSPVRTIRPETTIHEAQRILLRYGHSGLSVVDGGDRLVGVISRRDLDIALHHGFSHAPVKGYMTTNLKTILPDTPLPEIEDLMVTYDIGRLPVLEKNRLVGIVTRTDVLRELHQNQSIGNRERTNNSLASYCPLPEDIQQQLRSRMAPELWELLASAARLAEKRGWHLYLVGGAVRDVLLAGERGEGEGGRGREKGEGRREKGEGRREKGEERISQFLNPQSPIPNPQSPIPNPQSPITDIDLVVDGFHNSADVGAGVELAKALQKRYRSPRLQVHGQFQTAALLWHKDPVLDSLWIDIATARTEFYPYPAANPEVEASSIRQDLYRRDFTINALAVRLTEPRSGELLDFFGGLLDLRSRSIRVLHPNSFIEDPTRIYRAVRFAVRLGFQIEPQTEGYIRHAIESGIYDRARSALERSPALETRLKSELKYILQAPYWKGALQMLASLGALKCIHPSLELDRQLWKQVRLADRGLRRFDPDKTLEHWQIRLEVLIAHLQPESRNLVANTLQLADDSIKRLSQLEQALTEVSVALDQCQRPSQIVQLLRKYDVPTLILMAVKTSRGLRLGQGPTHRRLIWEYLTRWSHVKPLLDGNDLKVLGYKPGPEFKKILDELLAATVDGMISDRADAETFLAQQFPLLEK